MGTRRKLRLIALLIYLTGFQPAMPQSDMPWSTDGGSPQIKALQKQIESGNTGAVEQFWADLAAHHAPLIESIPGDHTQSIVTFIYRGSRDTTAVVLYTQMMMGRDPLVNQLTRLGNTDVWYKTYSVRNDMRLGYSFMPNPDQESLNNPSAGIADPLNPMTAPQAPYMGKSVLELPGAPPQPWVAPR